MNEGNDKAGFKDIPRLLDIITETQVLSVKSQTLSGLAAWRHVDAMDVIAHSNRLMACIATEEYTKKHFPLQYKSLNCQDIYEAHLAHYGSNNNKFEPSMIDDSSWID